MTGRALPWDWYPEPLPENVVLGEHSWIYSSFAFLHHRSEQPEAVRIGDDTGIYHGSFFLTGTRARVRIGSFWSIVGATFATNGSISLGDYGFAAHSVTFSDHALALPPDAGRSAEGAHIEVGDNVWIGARATILGGSRIGEGSVVGAGSVVASDVPPFSIVAGNPAKVVASATRSEEGL